MGSYALIKNGIVINKIVWDGENDLNFGEGVTSVELPSDQLVDIGYSYQDGKFIAPPLTEEEIEAQKAAQLGSNIALKDSMMAEASQRVSILQDAVDLEMATDEEAAALPLWKKYRVLLSRTNAAITGEVNWPEMPVWPNPAR